MDAISYLKQEHAKFRRTLKEISKAKSITLKKRKFKTFCKDLLAHEKAEQNVFYPAIKKTKDIRDVIKHLIGEEKSAAQAIKKFNKVGFDFMWKLRFAKFKHDVDHHARGEEQELFPKVRKAIDKSVLNTLGNKIKAYKAKIK